MHPALYIALHASYIAPQELHHSLRTGACERLQDADLCVAAMGCCWWLDEWTSEREWCAVCSRQKEFIARRHSAAVAKVKQSPVIASPTPFAIVGIQTLTLVIDEDTTSTISSHHRSNDADVSRAPLIHEEVHIETTVITEEPDVAHFMWCHVRCFFLPAAGILCVFLIMKRLTDQCIARKRRAVLVSPAVRDAESCITFKH